MCYEVAVLDRDGQYFEAHDLPYTSECPGESWNTTVKWARQTAAEIAAEHGIPLRKGLVFQDQELMMTAAEVRDIP